MLENRVKRIMREGGMALAAYGGCFGSASIVEIIGHAGFDAVFIDMEHMAFDLGEVQGMVRAAERMGITSIVRTPGFDPAFILRLLDLGAQGIQVPHIAGAAGARAAAQAVRYPPLGDRGIMAHSRAADYGRVPLGRHMEESNREVLLAVMIEDIPAVDEIEEIVATEGVDTVAVGPSDLGRALGVATEPDHPKLVAAIERVAEAARKGGKGLSLPLGHPLFPRNLGQLRDLGVSYCNCGPAPEVRLLRSFTQQVSDLRGQIG